MYDKPDKPGSSFPSSCPQPETPSIYKSLLILTHHLVDFAAYDHYWNLKKIHSDIRSVYIDHHRPVDMFHSVSFNFIGGVSRYLWWPYKIRQFLYGGWRADEEWFVDCGWGIADGVWRMTGEWCGERCVTQNQKASYKTIIHSYGCYHGMLHLRIMKLSAEFRLHMITFETHGKPHEIGKWWSCLWGILCWW